MRTRTVGFGLGVIVVLLAACSGGSSSGSSSSTGSTGSQQSTAAGSSSAGSSSSGGASFRPSGCTTPTADAIGSAFGAAITKTTPTADNGCLWEAGGLGHSVQVSYHPSSDFPAERIAVLKAGATPVSVPGATDAFVKHVSINGQDNDVEYIVFDAGTVQISFGGATGSLTAQNESAVTTAIVG
jgi:hypothetical protein